MSTIVALAYAITLVLVAVHAWSEKLTFLRGTPRSIWLSMAGGVSVAYVFVHLLPELSSAEPKIKAAIDARGVLAHHVYLVALVGLLTFYGLQKLSVRSRAVSRGPEGVGKQDDAGRMPTAVFWLHLSSFGLYNVLVGYLLFHREKPGLLSLLWFGIAMALHFLVTDFGLQDDYKGLYRQIGRYVLSVAVVGGMVLGQLTHVPEAFEGVLMAFLGGGVILNVLKEEMPAERESRFWAFALGAAVYAGLLLLL